ncbi:MAG: acyltransferase family protein [Bacteroidales bacterium]|nr:acyltransferase family protein [Bacteroidales bacterium]
MGKTFLDMRPNCLDYAKVLAMYFVVLGHYGMTARYEIQNTAIWNTDYFITMFHMPLFFIVSGMLHKPTTLKITWRKIYKSLLIPYFLIAFIIFFIIQVTHFLNNCFTLKDAVLHLLGILSSNDFLGADRYGGSLWFLFALAIIKMLKAVTDNLNQTALFDFILCIIGIGFTFGGNILPFRIDSALVGFLFYCIGFYGKALISKILLLNKLQLITLCVLSLLFTMWASTFCLKYGEVGGAMSINAMRFGDYPLLFLFSSIVASLGVLCFSKIFCHIRSFVILTLSNGSIIILGFHWVVFLFIFNFYKTDNLVAAMFISGVVMTICYFIILFVERYIPILLGGRKTR